MTKQEAKQYKIELEAQKIELEAQIAELQKIIDAPEKPTAEEWILNYLSKRFTVKFIKGYIIYYIEDQWIFQQDLKNDTLWCYYYKVWQVFETEYNMSYEQIQALHKEVVGEALNCKEFTPKQL